MTKTWVTVVAFGMAGLLLSLLLVYVMQLEPSLNPQPQDLSFLKEVKSTDERLQNGKYQFKVRCSTCHGFQGEGGSRGPALNDANWIYGDSRESKFSIVFNGSPTKKMKGWGSKLRQEDIVDLVLFVESLSNSQ